MQGLTARYPEEKVDVDKFEQIINLLERINGAQRETVVQVLNQSFCGVLVS